ncbi:hypothetical protein [Tardiphaga robiniae]|uniref:Uncharacterized protein n=1 Tax=Tardiphaga robiniae TaxID=943830 RepID=A0A163XTQ0_9BRAD|nr:hypothetical protein [Tardiphaga robiniae]KZD21353.1 hypothetical protein A4A58_13290 [Tardiphaga robiniae]
MSDEDEPVTEIAATPVLVPETNRLWRLTPALDLLAKSRQIAIVPAETEDVARAIATTADPMGRDWRDPHAFAADSIETSERHVIGDVIFRSTPAPAAAKAKRSKRG